MQCSQSPPSTWGDVREQGEEGGDVEDVDVVDPAAVAVGDAQNANRRDHQQVERRRPASRRIHKKHKSYN